MKGVRGDGSREGREQVGGRKSGARKIKLGEVEEEKL